MVKFFDMKDSRSRRALFLGLVGMALSLPAVLALEAALRKYILPPDFELLRAALGDYFTPFAWFCVLLTAAATPAGFLSHRPLQRWALAKPSPGGGAKRPEMAALEALMLSASIVQMPAVIAAFAYLLGSALTPVVIVMVVSTVGVMSLWFVVEIEP